MEDKTYDDEIYKDITTGIRWYTDNFNLTTSLFYLEHEGHIFETSEQLDPSNPNAFAFFKQNSDSGYEYGTETNGEFRFSDKLSMGLSLGYMSSVIHFGDHDDHDDTMITEMITVMTMMDDHDDHDGDDHDDDHDEMITMTMMAMTMMIMMEMDMMNMEKKLMLQIGIIV